MDKVSVLMITHNKQRFLNRSIPAIYESFDSEIEHEFLLLDNGSTDGTEYTVRRMMDGGMRLIYYRSEENLGLNGYSLLYESSSGGIIVTVDDDIFYVSPYWEKIFSRILNAKFDGSSFGYVGSLPINKDGGMADVKWGAASIDGIDIIVCPVGGWFAATKRDILNEIGGFHNGREEMYLEDADIQRRAWDNGYICGIAKPVNVFHARSPNYYKSLGCIQTYLRRMELARRVGIELEKPS